MGAAASFVKGQIKEVDDAKGKENEIKEALDNMYQMAEDQLTAFYERIGNASYDIKLIPIKKVLSHYQYIQCADSEQDHIGNAIKDSVKDFSTGPMAEGLANLGASVISRLLGSSKGMRQMETKYGISRLDTFFFVYNFEAAGLMKTAKSVVASCVVKSSADTKEVDDNTLRVLVNECFDASPLELRKAIYSEIREALFNSNDEAYLESLRQARLSNSKMLSDWAKPNVNKARAMKDLIKGGPTEEICN